MLFSSSGGWSPQLESIPFEDGSIMRVVRWMGGPGDPLPSGLFVASNGFTDDANEAVKFSRLSKAESCRKMYNKLRLLYEGFLPLKLHKVPDFNLASLLLRRQPIFDSLVVRFLQTVGELFFFCPGQLFFAHQFRNQVAIESQRLPKNVIGGPRVHCPHKRNTDLEQGLFVGFCQDFIKKVEGLRKSIAAGLHAVKNSVVHVRCPLIVDGRRLVERDILFSESLTVQEFWPQVVSFPS